MSWAHGYQRLLNLAEVVPPRHQVVSLDQKLPACTLFSVYPYTAVLPRRGQEYPKVCPMGFKNSVAYVQCQVESSSLRYMCIPPRVH